MVIALIAIPLIYIFDQKLPFLTNESLETCQIFLILIDFPLLFSNMIY